MNKIRKNISIKETLLKDIEDFNSLSNYENINDKMNEIFSTFFELNNYTKIELINTLSLEEIKLMISAIQGKNYLSSIEPKMFLLSNINNALILQKDSKFSTVIEKIKTLSSFQCYMIIALIKKCEKEFLSINFTSAATDSNTEKDNIIRKEFLIED